MRYVLGAGGGGDTVCLDVTADQLHGIVITGATRSGALLPSSLVLSATEAQAPDTLRVWLVRPDRTDPSILKAKLAFLEKQLPSTDLTQLRQEVDGRVEAFHRDTLLSALPHVDHFIAGDGSAATLAELAASEIDRRLDLLDRAGTQDWTDYTWLRNHQRADLAPLPQILIQADQYPTLLASEGSEGTDPQIAGALNRLCAAGRCTGIALQLCSNALTFETGRRLLSSMSYTIAMGDVDHETLRILGRTDIEAAARPGRAVLHYRGNLTTFTPTHTM